MAMLVKAVPTFLMHVFAPVLGVCLAAWFVSLLTSAISGKRRSPRRGLGKSVWAGLFVLALACTSLVGKGPGGTNGVQSLPPRPMRQPPAPTPPSILDYPRTLTAARVAAGFALVGVGTNETFSFDPPADAVVCGDWRTYGSASRWTDVTPADFSFPFGGTNATTFTFVPGGVAYLAGGADAPRLLPFRAQMGVVPERLWEGFGVTSRLWTATSPSNTFIATWQGALLGRRTDGPVDVQAELFPDGGFDFRYGLSRLASDDALQDVRIGAWNAGGGETYSVPHRNLTSARWRPVVPEDATDPDWDGDGVATEDELFVYHTDPRHPDSDYDGLTDYEELFVYHTNPLDPYSAGGPHCDGLAVRLGGLAPFAYPEGSTNTVLEHVFYSGTTNGAFAYPQSDTDTAILRVTVSGTGVGRLVVGDSVVPLVAPPQMRNGTTTNILLLAVGRGETYPAYLYGDESLAVSLDSDDFAFGTLPTFNAFGHINFPNTEATPACIHDFNSRNRFVSLPTREDAELLAATWTGGEGVSVSNVPPRSTVINANFYAGSIKNVSYSLSHPQYLFGQTQYSQPVRFCPRPKRKPSGTPDPDAPDDEYSDTPDPDEPTWFSSGEDVSSTGNDGQDGEDNAVGDNEDFDDYCPEHSMLYGDCDGEHEEEYTNSLQSVEHLGGVLYIREPPLYEPIYLEVPTEHVNCCPCPEHWEDYVGVAYKSYRLRLVGPGGFPFDRTETPCSVNLAGVYPSSAVGDAEIAFSRNGDIYQHQHRTVLGVAIKGHPFDLAPYNALNPDFGYPMTVCTNLWHAPQMRLVTNVKLQGGHVRLELADASGQFMVWYEDIHGGTYRKLIDTSTTRVKNLPMAYWKALMRRATDGDTPELPIYITSSAPGAVTLKFRYWNVIDGKLVEDEAVQRVTSIEPSLLADMDGNGAFGNGDISRCLGGRLFRFWTNEDRHKGDYVGQVSDTVTNTADLAVNGRLDLVNLFPVRIDLKPFIDAWGSAATFHLSGPDGGLRFCRPDVSVESAWAYHTNDVYTTTGQPMSSATLTAVSREGMEIAPGACLGAGNAPGVLAFEAVREIYSYYSLELQVKVGGVTLFRYSAPWSISSVRAMYRWRNIRSACGDYRGEGDSRYAPWNNPDEECDGRHFVFVHGYNVNPAAAREWADSFFKRLWLAGSRSMFTAVDWYGDSSQFASLFHGDVSPDYYANVVHAFASAPNLVETVAALPGTNKVMLAHSLGNMLVSSAAKDCGLQYSRYYMLNAAVAMEAYDETEFSQNMVDSAWSGVPPNYRASDWNKLFQASTNDFRYSLSWQGRFAGIANAVNCYSETEDVLANASSYGYGEAWAQQELFKGTTVWHGLNAIPFLGFDIACEGGWGVNTVYALNPAVYTPGYGFHSSVMDDITRKDAIEHPLFTPFRSEAESMHSTNLFTIANANTRKTLHAKFLADAIPATSFAAGANETSGVTENYNMQSQSVFGWPRRNNNRDLWYHSDLKNIAFYFVNSLFLKIVGETNDE